MFKKLFGPKPPKLPPRDVETLTASLASPALHLVTQSEASLSYFGGVPKTPDGFVWPSSKGRPLDFLACIDLGEVAQAAQLEWLPQVGALLFFYDLQNHPWGYDPKHRGGWSVVYVPNQPTMDEASTRNGALVHKRYLGFRRINKLPSWERPGVEALQLNDDESNIFIDLQDKVFDDKPHHQIGGFPLTVQGDGMELECQLASNGLYCGDSTGYEHPHAKLLAEGAADWRLLLQIDSDDELEWMWGDGGTLYFWVKENDARNGNFSNSWVVLQCY